MMSRRERGSAEGPNTHAASERLDSWKEIAVYLRRSVRTVQRWEETEDLPVHRHVHEQRGSVYAYRQELDAWWNNRAPRLEAEEASISRGRFNWRAVVWASLAAVLVLAAVALVGLRVRTPRASGEGSLSSFQFEEEGWVLLASFDNRTGEPLFDDSLEYALERELARSRYVRVVPRQRVQDVLRLMNQPADTKLDPELAREICLRDGEIGAVLTGRTERFGSKYLLSVAVMDPTEGSNVAVLSEEASSQEDVLTALRTISNRVRQTLGEGLPAVDRQEQRLGRVTTPSLRALQLYTLADNLFLEQKDRAAEELLRQAIAEDPEFASGYLHLAWAIRRQNRDKAEYLPFAARALELAEASAEPERHFIQGSYHYMTGSDEEALAAFEALLALQPDHMWGNNLLITTLFRLGRELEALPYVIRRAEILPNNFLANSWAVTALAVWDGNPAAARPYVERALDLVSPEIELRHARDLMSLQFFPVCDALLAGDVNDALRQADHFTETFEPEDGSEAIADYVYTVAPFYLMLGRTEEVVAFINMLPNPNDRHETLSRITFLNGDLDVTRKQLLKALEGGSAMRPVTGILLARIGLLEEADALLSSFERRDILVPGYRETVRGEIAWARGRMDEALPLLEIGVEGVTTMGHATFFLGLESLAEILMQEGKVEEALRALEVTSQPEVKARAVFHSSGVFWMRSRLHLVRLYRELGRDEAARMIEAELRELLTYADPGHPMLVELQRLPSLRTS